jgi:hypothetical protein
LPPLKHRGKRDAPAVSSPKERATTEQPLTWTVARLEVCVNRHFLEAEGVDTAPLTFLPPITVPAAASLGKGCNVR